MKLTCVFFRNRQRRMEFKKITSRISLILVIVFSYTISTYSHEVDCQSCCCCEFEHSVSCECLTENDNDEQFPIYALASSIKNILDYSNYYSLPNPTLFQVEPLLIGSAGNKYFIPSIKKYASRSVVLLI